MVISAFTPAIPAKPFLTSICICKKPMTCSLPCTTCNKTLELIHYDTTPHMSAARDSSTTSRPTSPHLLISLTATVATAAATLIAGRPRACTAATNEQPVPLLTQTVHPCERTREAHGSSLQSSPAASATSHPVLRVHPVPVPSSQDRDDPLVPLPSSTTTSTPPIGTPYDPAPTPTTSSPSPPATKRANPHLPSPAPPNSNSSKSSSSTSGTTGFHASLSEWSHGSAPRRGPSATFGGLGPGSASASAVARAATNAARVPSSTTVGLVGVGALTSGSVLLQRARRGRSDRSTSGSSDYRSRLHNVCTVVCLQIPFCVRERGHLIKGLNDLILSQSCSDAASIARACCAAASLLQGQAGVMEDSRCFAPHVDMFLAESIEEAERRFSAHVTIESARIDRVAQGDVGAVAFDDGDYGVVTMVVATNGGVDLHCYDDGMTNLQRLRSALDAIGRLREGEVAGLELLWIPDKVGARSMSRAQMLDSFPSLRIA